MNIDLLEMCTSAKTGRSCPVQLSWASAAVAKRVLGSRSNETF
jgi:hypothetical protein